MSDDIPTGEQLEALLDQCDSYLDGRKEPITDDRYIRGIKDALGWVLGYYDRPFEE